MEEKKSRGAYMTDYNKKTYQRLEVKFNKNTENDLIKHLKKQDNMQAYIKNLIRKDMK